MILRWIKKIFADRSRIYAPCANGNCLHTLDSTGPNYVEVDTDFEGIVYCSVDCMRANQKVKSANN